VIDLYKVLRDIPGCSLLVERLTALTSRHSTFDQRRASIQTFKTGKSMVMGAQSYIVSLLFVHILCGMLRGIGIPVRMGRLIPINRVSGGKCNSGLDVDHFDEKFDRTTAVKHERSFSGIIHTIELNNNNQTEQSSVVTVPLFGTGAYIVMGRSAEKQHQEICKKLFPVLKRNQNNYKSQHTQTSALVKKIAENWSATYKSRINDLLPSEILNLILNTK
jgi:TATA-box binding protein (TBP) (component of TFIID and TFIIIB)